MTRDRAKITRVLTFVAIAGPIYYIRGSSPCSACSGRATTRSPEPRASWRGERSRIEL